MKCSLLLVTAVMLAASASALAQTVITYPMDAQINLGGGGTNDSPDGDAIYIPTWNSREYLEFMSDEPDGYTRCWIQGLDPNSAGGYYYGPYIDFVLAGDGPFDFTGAPSTLEFDCRYNQDPFSNGNPYDDAPIFCRVYTFDDPNDVYQGYMDFGLVYQTGPLNQCVDKPTGYPEWKHVVVDTADNSIDYNCDNQNDRSTGGVFDMTHVSRMRFWGTDWQATGLGPANDWIDIKNVVLTLYPPPCDYDLDGDGDVDLLDLSTLLIDFGCAPYLDGAYDTGGFEGYTLGDLPGQDGWVEDSTDPGYGKVQIINDPTSGGTHGKVMAIDPPGTAGGWLGAYRAITPPTQRFVFIEWDQYRTDTGDNVWYADNPDFANWWAMQWDQNGQASSYFFDFGVAITPLQWQHVSYSIDTVNGDVTVDIDGVQFSSAMTPATFRGLCFEVEPTEASGENGPIYVDNLTITETNVDPLAGCAVDLNGDHKTDLIDLSMLLTNFGCTP